MNKKKVIPLVLLPLLAIIIAAVFVRINYSKADSGNDFTISKDTLTKYSGSDSNVVIPDGVKTIGKEAFAGNNKIVSVKIPSTVKKIDYSAFSSCKNLESIIIPDSVENVGDSAFNGCEKLKNVRIGKNLSILGSGVFSNCASLEAVSIDPSNNNLCYENGVIYNSDKTILYQYLNNYPAKSYIMPNSVTTISRYSFNGCKNLKDVSLSTGLTKVPQYAFYNCDSLENVTIYSPVREISLGAFESCSNLKQVTIPISLSSIHDNAFNSCSDELTFICDKNSSINSYAVSKGIKTSTTPVYTANYSDDEIIDTENNDNNANPSNNGNDDYVVEDWINGEFTSKEEEDAVLLGNTSVVSDRVFIMYDGFKVVNGQNKKGDNSQNVATLSCINDYAFYKNEDMQYYNFDKSNNIEAIGMLSFARTNMIEIHIPDGIKTIGYGAFYHSDRLRVIDIPDSVVNIEAYAFDYTAWYKDWYNNSNDDFLIVGDGVLYSYKGNDENVIVPDGVKCISSNAFKDHSEIKSITFDNDLKVINDNAFSGCNIEEINGLPETISISDNAFK